MFGKKKQKQQEVPETNVRTHESGYIMRTGEHMVLGQEATSPEGNGWLLATNKSLFFIHGGRGVYLYLDHGMIKSLGNEKGKITVKWLEKGRQFEFQMRLKDGFYTPDEVVNMLNTRFQYAEPALNHIELTEKEIGEARKDRLERIGRILGNIQKEVTRLQQKKELDQEEQDDLKRALFHQTMAAKNERCITSMQFVRSAKVPAHVPLTMVWNDCYFDDKRKLYVTFRRFRNGLGPETLNSNSSQPEGAQPRRRRHGIPHRQGGLSLRLSCRRHKDRRRPLYCQPAVHYVRGDDYRRSRYGTVGHTRFPGRQGRRVHGKGLV